MKKQFLEAGKIANTHGIRGEVRITPWTDTPEDFCRLKTIYIEETPTLLLSARVHKRSVITGLSGVEDVNAAMALKNKLVFLNRDDVSLPEGGFFIQDLMDMPIYEEKTETMLGHITDVIFGPAHNIYVVTGEKERLIPAVPEFIRETNLESNFMKVHLIEGL